MIDLNKSTLANEEIEYLKSLSEEEFWTYIYDKYYIDQYLSGIKIGKLLGCGHHYIYKNFKKYDLKSRSFKDMGNKYKCDETFFDEIDTEEKAYWLGFMYADGFISVGSTDTCSRKIGLSLAECDKEHIEKLKNALQAENPIYTYKVSNGYNPNSTYCRLMIFSEQLVKSLIDKGCTEHKTDIITYPTTDQVPYKLQRHFIRGYMDGDGSISVTKANKRINHDSYEIKFAGTEHILKGIQNYLIENNVIDRTYKLGKRKQEHIVMNFEFGGNFLSHRFLSWIYKDATIYLERKHNRYLALDEYVKSNEEWRSRGNKSKLYSIPPTY